MVCCSGEQRNNKRRSDRQRTQAGEKHRARRAILGNLDLGTKSRVDEIGQAFQCSIELLRGQHHGNRERHDCPPDRCGTKTDQRNQHAGGGEALQAKTILRTQRLDDAR